MIGMGLVPAAYLHRAVMPSGWIVTLLTRLTTRRNPYASDLRLRYPTPPLWVPTHNMTIGQRLAHDEAYREAYAGLDAGAVPAGAGACRRIRVHSLRLAVLWRRLRSLLGTRRPPVRLRSATGWRPSR